MPLGLERYGLLANPYARRELNPLTNEGHEKLLIRVDGFNQLDDIDTYLARAAKESNTCFFLVTGESGAGRTSAANYILARYRHHRGIPPERFIVPSRKTEDYDWVAVFRRWMLSLSTEIYLKRVSLPPQLAADFKELAARLDKDTLEPICHDLLVRIADELAQDPRRAAFGLCFENVREYRMISSAYEIFEGVPSICVFTTLDNAERRTDVIDPFRKKAAGSRRLVELSGLRGDDVEKVVEAHWAQAAAAVPPPFAPGAVRAIFNDKDRPIGRILVLFEGVLEAKLLAVGEGAAWPAPELRFDAPGLKGLVALLERQAIAP
jgi:hypothetical protein